MSYNGSWYNNGWYNNAFYFDGQSVIANVSIPPRFNKGDRVKHVYWGLGTVDSSEYDWGFVIFDILPNKIPMKVLYKYDDIVAENLIHVDLVTGT